MICLEWYYVVELAVVTFFAGAYAFSVVVLWAEGGPLTPWSEK